MEKSQQESPQSPPELGSFIEEIEWPDDRNKQHLRDIVAMVREGASDAWVKNYHRSVEWYKGKEGRDNALKEHLPEELQDTDPIEEGRRHRDEYLWLESAVQTALDEGYLSERDEARTRFLLARAAGISA